MSRRRDVTPGSLVPARFFVLRTPLLPFDELVALGDGASSEPAERQHSRREKLRRLVALPEVREALFLASPSLEESLASWLEAPDSDRGQRVERSLFKYVVRMSGRATPFGLFAGNALGAIGEHTSLRIGPRASYRRHSRLDAQSLFKMVAVLSQRPELKNRLSYQWASGLDRRSSRWRWQARTFDGEHLTYRFVSAEASPHLDAVIERARHGASLAELCQAVVAVDTELEFSEAEGFVSSILETQLLVPDFGFTITGDEPEVVLSRRLRDLGPEGEDLVTTLTTAREALLGMDRGGLGVSAARYRSLIDALHLPPSELPRGAPFQVDLAKPGDHLTLGGAPVREIARGIELLHRIGGRSDALREFREAFVSRYGDQEVDLLEALDDETGLGLGDSASAGSPILAGLELPHGEAPLPPFDRRQNHLLRKTQLAMLAGDDAIELSEDDVQRLSIESPPPFPESCSAMVRLAARSDAEIARGAFRVYIDAVSGPSGAQILGRFCHGQPDLTVEVRRLMQAESVHAPEAILAEIVHLPAGRVGNILFRPLLRDYEIPFHGSSGAPLERQLAVQDLAISVVEGRLVLRSRTLDREILPRLATAHDYSNRELSKVYRFLCQLQHQSAATELSWSWGALGAAPWLPRVTSGRVVLAPARWRLDAGEIDRLLHQKDGVLAAVQALRRSRRMPRWVVFVEYDHLFPLDLQAPFGAEMLGDLLRSKTDALLEELWPPPDELCVTGPEGRFVHELIVPFQKSPPIPAPDLSTRRPDLRRGTGRFPLGSEWLCTRFDSGAAEADHLLVEVVRPAIAQLVESGGVDRWFFTRTEGPGLMLALHGGAWSLLVDALPGLVQRLEAAIREGKASDLTAQSYKRDIAGYGGEEGIAVAERIFQVDSETALQLIAETLSDLDGRWRLALTGAYLLLDDLSLSSEQRQGVLKAVREDLRRRLRVESDALVLRQLSDRFRRERPALERMVKGDPPEPLKSALRILYLRSERLRPLAKELHELCREQRVTRSMDQLAARLIEATLHRILRTEGDAPAFVVSELLGRLCEAELGRLRGGGAGPGGVDAST